MIKFNIVTTLSAVPPKVFPDAYDPKSDEAHSTNFPIYFGTIESEDELETSIGNLPSILAYNRVFEWNNIISDNKKLCYAYPAIFGQLEEIKDEYGHDIYGEFVGYEIDFNNIVYFVYVTAEPITLTGTKVLFR